MRLEGGGQDELKRKEAVLRHKIWTIGCNFKEQFGKEPLDAKVLFLPLGRSDPAGLRYLQGPQSCAPRRRLSLPPSAAETETRDASEPQRFEGLRQGKGPHCQVPSIVVKRRGERRRGRAKRVHTLPPKEPRRTQTDNTRRSYSTVCEGTAYMQQKPLCLSSGALE